MHGRFVGFHHAGPIRLQFQHVRDVGFSSTAHRLNFRRGIVFHFVFLVPGLLQMHDLPAYQFPTNSGLDSGGHVVFLKVLPTAGQLIPGQSTSEMGLQQRRRTFSFLVVPHRHHQSTGVPRSPSVLHHQRCSEQIGSFFTFTVHDAPHSASPGPLDTIHGPVQFNLRQQFRHLLARGHPTVQGLNDGGASAFQLFAQTIFQIFDHDASNVRTGTALHFSYRTVLFNKFLLDALPFHPGPPQFKRMVQIFVSQTIAQMFQIFARF